MRRLEPLGLALPTPPPIGSADEAGTGIDDGPGKPGYQGEAPPESAPP
jgi:hypothetical protein